MVEFAGELADSEGAVARVWELAKWDGDNTVNRMVVVAVLELHQSSNGGDFSSDDRSGDSQN